jgi:uncharacterized membrane protein
MRRKGIIGGTVAGVLVFLLVICYLRRRYAVRASPPLVEQGTLVGAVCVKYLQTFSLSTNNNVCQHCSRENRVFANIPSGERAYFCIT